MIKIKKYDLKIAVYTICYNEEWMLPFFIDHYSEFATKIFFYDNHSTDNSHRLIKSTPKAIFRSYSSSNQIRDDIMLDVKNHCWKHTREYDWVIVVDVDEFIYHPNIIGFLKKEKMVGNTLLIPHGFDMICNKMPLHKEKIYDQVKLGIYNIEYSKACIWNPKEIREINYKHGCHKCKPQGNVIKSSQPELKLLHYRYLTFEHTLKKYQERAHRLSRINSINNWGFQYKMSKEELLKEYEEVKNNAIKVIP